MKRADKNPSDADSDDKAMNKNQKEKNENRDETKLMNTNEVKNSRTRQVLGGAMNQVADVINDNLVPFRYGTMASIFLLTAYGVSKTPMFFRFRNISEIPSSFFTMRKTVHGRIVHIVENPSNNGNTGDIESKRPITCLIHLVSPISRILNRPLFDMYLKNNPSSLQFLGGRLEDSKDLLRVEIAGIQSPPPYFAPPGAEQSGAWLRQLANERTPVVCTLLSRKIDTKTLEKSKSVVSDIPNISPNHVSNKNKYSNPPSEEAVAICKLAYRTSKISLFRKDLGTIMVGSGRAAVAEGIFMENESMSNVDSSTRIIDLKNDANYMEHLGKMEYDALKNSMGMWAYPSVRETRPDLLEEANFEANASIWRKLWRRLFRE